MSIEELLKPRYKVMSDYPTSRMYFQVGDVLTTDYSQGVERVIGGKDASMSPLTVKSYPHIFKHLQWWEERKPEDMPEYVKGNVGSFFRVMKVAHPNQNFRLFHIENEIEHRFAYKGQYEPATKEDYETYLTNNKLNP